jgi:hypothetical protein
MRLNNTAPRAYSFFADPDVPRMAFAELRAGCFWPARVYTLRRAFNLSIALAKGPFSQGSKDIHLPSFLLRVLGAMMRSDFVAISIVKTVVLQVRAT